MATRTGSEACRAVAGLTAVDHLAAETGLVGHCLTDIEIPLFVGRLAIRSHAPLRKACELRAELHGHCDRVTGCAQAIDHTHHAGLLAADLQAFVAEHVATYKQIRVVEFVDEIPKSASGKILRRVLRDRG